MVIILKQFYHTFQKRGIRYSFIYIICTCCRDTSYRSSGVSAVTTGIWLTDVRSENLSFIRNPFFLISSAHFPRASRVTSFPARNKFLARLQPNTPAPYIRIFIALLLFVEFSSISSVSRLVTIFGVVFQILVFVSADGEIALAAVCTSAWPPINYAAWRTPPLGKR